MLEWAMLGPEGEDVMRIVFLFLICVASMAQTSDPAFDAASIRPSPPLDTSRGQFNFGPGGGPGAADPALYTCHFCTVSQLIAQAYDLPEYRIFSARGITDERFDVIARVPAGATLRAVAGDASAFARRAIQTRSAPRVARDADFPVSRGPKRTEIDGTSKTHRCQRIGRSTSGIVNAASLTKAKERR